MRDIWRPHRVGVRRKLGLTLVAVLGALLSAAGLLALSPAVASAAVGHGPQPPCTPGPVDQSACLRSWLGAEMSSHPWGFTWNATGQSWEVDQGIALNGANGLTINGGTFHSDERTAPKGPNGNWLGEGHPIFLFNAGNRVTLQNVTITGSHLKGGFGSTIAGHMFNNAAIRLDGTQHFTLTNAVLADVFGDGVNFEPLRQTFGQSAILAVPSARLTNVSVTDAGRTGLAPVSVNGLTVHELRLSDNGLNAIDMEADQSGEGARHVFIDGAVMGGISIASSGRATGPITIEHWTMPHTNSGVAVNVGNKAGSPDAGPISFIDDSLRCGASGDAGCFQIQSGNQLVVRNSTITIGYPHYGNHENIYRAFGLSRVSFVNDTMLAAGGGTRAYSHGVCFGDTIVNVVGGHGWPAKQGCASTSSSGTTSADISRSAHRTRRVAHGSSAPGHAMVRTGSVTDRNNPTTSGGGAHSSTSGYGSTAGASASTTQPLGTLGPSAPASTTTTSSPGHVSPVQGGGHAKVRHISRRHSVVGRSEQ
jgi:hypothetical protein